MLRGKLETLLAKMEKRIILAKKSKLDEFYIEGLSYKWRIEEDRLIGRDELRGFDVVEVPFSDFFSVEEMRVLIEVNIKGGYDEKSTSVGKTRRSSKPSRSSDHQERD